MAKAGRNQPNTLDLQKVGKQNSNQKTKNDAASKKKNPQKFNTGVNLEAVFGAISQLLETFTNQVLDSSSVNRSLVLRTIYRNLNDDLVGILTEQKNVDALNKQLEEKNKEVAEALAGGKQASETTPAQGTPDKEKLTRTVTNTERITDKVIEKAPEVNVSAPKVLTNVVEKESTVTLPDKVEEGRVTERTEVLPEERTETRIPLTPKRKATPDVSRTQRAFAAGEITSDDDIDILQLAQDFITELESDTWRMRGTVQGMAQGLTDKYDEFVDKIDQDDEDEYEWNLYRYMFRRQQEQNDLRRERLVEILAKRSMAVQAPVGAREEEEPKEEEPRGGSKEPTPAKEETKREPEKPQAKKTEEGDDLGPEERKQEESKKEKPKKKKQGVFQAIFGRLKKSVEIRKKALLDKIIPKMPTIDLSGDIENQEQPKGLFAAIMHPFLERRRKRLLLKELTGAAKDKDSVVLVAPDPLRKTVLLRLKNGKKILQLVGKDGGVEALLEGKGDKKSEQSKEPQGLFSWFFKNKTTQVKKQVQAPQKQQEKAPAPTMIGRGIMRTANTINTVRNIFFRPKVEHIAVMNNAFIYPLRERRIGRGGRGPDSANNWKRVANNWRRTAFNWERTARYWMFMADRWHRLYMTWRSIAAKNAPRRPAPISRNTVGKRVARLSKAAPKAISGSKSTTRAGKKAGLKIASKGLRVVSKVTKGGRSKEGSFAFRDVASNIKPPSTGRIFSFSSLKDSLSTVKGSAPQAPVGTDLSAAGESEQGQPLTRGQRVVRGAKRVVGRLTSIFAPKQEQPQQPERQQGKPQQGQDEQAKQIEKTPPFDLKKITDFIRKAMKAKGKEKDKQGKPAAAMNSPKPQAKKKGAEEAKDLVTIPKSQVTQAKRLKDRQLQNQRQAEQQSKEQGDPNKRFGKRIGLGALAKRKNMSDDEAFRKNILEGNEGAAHVFEDKTVNNMGFPHKKIGEALKRFFNNTSKISKQASSDLDKVEDEINNPRKGLFGEIKSFLFKVVFGGLIAIGVMALVRKHFLSWLPRGKDGNILHGPTLFGVPLPNLKDILLIGRSLFYMVWSPLKKLYRSVKNGIATIKKSLHIDGIHSFTKFLGKFVAGFIAGKLADMVLGGGGLVGKIISFFKKSPGMGQIIDIIELGINLTALTVGFLWTAVEDMFKSSGASEDLIHAAAKEWSEEKLNELVGENRHGTKASNVLINKASEIKSIVPLQNILPDSMKAKDAKGNLQIKALIPNLPVINLSSGTLRDEQKDINAVAKVRTKNKKKEASKTGFSQIDAAMSKQQNVVWNNQYTEKYGDETPAKKASLKFLAYARKNMDVLIAARKNLTGNFDGEWSSDCWWIEDGKNPTKLWNPKWQYLGKNQEMLTSVMPPEPFGDSTGGKKYEIAKPWKHELMGVMPLAVIIPGTNAHYFVDALSWERDRLDIGIDAWRGAIKLVQDALDDGDEDELFGTKEFMERLQDGGWHHNGGDDWVRISTIPNGSSRIRPGRQQEMIEKYNKWRDKHAKVKESVDKAKKKAGLKTQEDIKKEEKKKTKWSRFWGSSAGKTVKFMAKWGTGIGWFTTAGKMVYTLFKKQDIEKIKKNPPPPPPPPPWGLIYIQKNILTKEPWRTLKNQKVKDGELRKLFKIDSWFNLVPDSDEKIYKEGIGKIFYNILLAMGFKYNKAVWQNPKFLLTRGTAMKTVVDSLTAYINDIIRPHGAYILALHDWAKTHLSPEEQNAVQHAAEVEHKKIWDEITKDKFMEYVGKFYVPTDIHLVIRDTTGKIIKEEGKELRGLSIPKELYDQDPAYWDYVMSLMNTSAIPPEKFEELQQIRAKLLMAIQSNAKRVEGYVKTLEVKKRRLNLANMIADMILAARMGMLTRGASNLKFRIALAKKEVDLYFKYRKFLETGSLGAFRSFILGGNKLSKKEQTELFGKQLEGGGKSVSERMLGSVSEVIADRRRLIARMRAVIKRIMTGGDKVLRDNFRMGLNMVKSVVKSAGSKVLSLAKGAKSAFKGFVMGRLKMGLKAVQTIKKATRVNLNLFKLFRKKQADDNDVRIQVDAAAKEMIPPEDTDGKEKLAAIVKMSQDRKKAAEMEKSGLKGYWDKLRREWKDRISEESMKELKTASGRLSNNILDYLSMVREIPPGNTTVVTTTINQTANVMELLPEITF